MFKLNYIIAFLFSLSPLASAADGTVLSGRITDSRGEPMAYVNVFIAESFEGTVTNQNGRWSFVSSQRGVVTLRATYMGYRTHEEKVHLKSGASLLFVIQLKPQAVQGETITVTAGSFRADDEPGSTLTAMDVIRTPGAAADLFWAVKSLPGVQQATEGAGLFVRGGDVSETAIYLDGALITHPYRYESPTGGFFGTFSPFLLKGTYFSSGGYGAQYGHGISGVLSMESLDMPVRRAMGVGIGLAAESAFLSLPLIKGRLGVNLSGNLSNTEMMFKLNGDLHRFSQVPRSSDLNLNLTARLSSSWRLKLFHFQERDEIGVFVEDPDQPGVFSNEAENRFTHAILKGVLPGGWGVRAVGGFSRYTQQPKMAAMDLDLSDDLVQARIHIEKAIRRGRVTLGAERMDARTRIYGLRALDDQETQTTVDQYEIDTDYRAVKWAAFCTAELALGPVKLLPGLRGTVVEGVDSPVLDPRLSAAWGVAPAWTATLALGRFHQSPKPEYFDAAVGNPNLGFMASDHLIVGVHYEKNKTLFRVEAYAKSYQNLLLNRSDLYYTNDGSGRAKGIDLFLKSQRGPVSGWISYSWVEARRKWMDLPVMASPDFDITHTLTWVLNCEITHRFNLGSSFRAATGRPYTPAPGAWQSRRVPAYFRLDLTGGYTTSLFGRDMTILYASCSNVLGRTNILDYNYSDDYARRVPIKSAYGRSVYFGLQINFQ